MAINQKDLIVVYRENGLSYREIADKTHTSEDYCRTICSRANRKKNPKPMVDGLCRFCGEPLVFTTGAKRKQFCSKQCRNGYTNRLKMRKPYICTCEYCKTEFVSYGNPERRFCSRKCRTLAARKDRDYNE